MQTCRFPESELVSAFSVSMMADAFWRLAHGRARSWCRKIFALFVAIPFAFPNARGDTITDVTNIQATARVTLYIGNRVPLQPSPLMRLPPGSIQPQGWLLNILQRQRNGLNG